MHETSHERWKRSTARLNIHSLNVEQVIKVIGPNMRSYSHTRIILKGTSLQPERGEDDELLQET